MSFKAAIKVSGESGLSYNGLRFATAEEAEGYAKNLRSRWFMMDSYVVEQSEDPVNYKWTGQGLEAVQGTAA